MIIPLKWNRGTLNIKGLNLVLILLLCSLTGRSQVILPTVLSNNAILQQKSNVLLWGKTKANASVRITTSWDNRSYTIKADKEGSFSQKVKTPAAGGPYTIMFNDGVETLLDNILIGEVWFCSGQSNMAMTMRGNKNQPILYSEELIASSENSQIRLFTANRKTSDTPLAEIRGQWSQASPEVVAKTSALAYQFAQKLHKKQQIPVGVIVSSWGGTPIRAWMSKESLQEIEDTIALVEGKPAQNPSTLYNGMVAPFLDYTIRGVLWYQGENDRLQPQLYREMMPAMVKDWRVKFKNRNMPFYYVQIAPWTYPADKGKQGATFYFRKMQYELRNVIRNSGIAVTSDVGSDQSIHPPDKTTVAERLLNVVLAKTYGFKAQKYLGPEARSLSIEHDKVIVHFDHVEKGLLLKKSRTDNFEIAGEDGVFYTAQVNIVGGDLEVWNEKVRYPVAIRYGFANYFQGNLFNKDGLPASSFWVAKEKNNL